MSSLNLRSADVSRSKLQGRHHPHMQQISLFHLLRLLLQFDQRGQEVAPQQVSSSLADDWLRVD